MFPAQRDANGPRGVSGSAVTRVLAARTGAAVTRLEGQWRRRRGEAEGQGVLNPAERSGTARLWYRAGGYAMERVDAVERCRSAHVTRA